MSVGGSHDVQNLTVVNMRSLLLETARFEQNVPQLSSYLQYPSLVCLALYWLRCFDLIFKSTSASL